MKDNLTLSKKALTLVYYLSFVSDDLEATNFTLKSFVFIKTVIIRTRYRFANKLKIIS